MHRQHFAGLGPAKESGLFQMGGMLAPTPSQLHGCARSYCMGTAVAGGRIAHPFPFVGAVLNDVPTSDDPSTFSFAGSTIVIQASSRDEIKEVLRRDVYAKSGVWDVENVGLPLSH